MPLGFFHLGNLTRESHGAVKSGRARIHFLSQHSEGGQHRCPTQVPLILWEEPHEGRLLGECRAGSHLTLGKSLNALGLSFLIYRTGRRSPVHRDAEREREREGRASTV